MKTAMMVKIEELESKLIEARAEIERLIKKYSLGDELKSMSESISDECFVEELKVIKRLVNNGNNKP